MRAKQIKIVILTGLLVLSAFAIANIMNQNSDLMLVEVNIQFNNTINEDVLEHLGATTRTRIESINTISVSIPANLVHLLDENPFIKSWEYNTQVQLFEDTIDWGVDRVDAERVWGGTEDAVDVTGTCGATIKVAVIDTGIDYTHPDLAPNYVGGYDFVNGDNDPLDDHYHGTHVSGTIAAADDEPNALSGSLVGVSPCVELYAVKVLDQRGSGTAADVAAGIEWTANNGMHIASLSLGSSSPSTTIQAAGEYAYSNGVLLVAASGNDGGAVGYPAAFPEFIAVGSTDQDDGLSSFSNFGPEQEVVAPGRDIMSTTPTYLGGGGPFNPSANYDTLSGTSMATPHVSAVAALAWSTDATLTNADIRGILQTSAEDLGVSGWDESFGYGIVDAEAAVAATGGSGGGDTGDTTAPSQVTGLTATAVSSSQIDLVWDAATDDTGVDHYNIYRDSVFVAQSTTTSYSDTGLAASTTYTYEVSAVDAAGNEGALSTPASATTDSDGGTTTDTMYVSAIDMWVSRQYGPWRDISIRVNVVDGNGNPLSGVSVSIDLELPDGSVITGTGTTDSNGDVVFLYEKASSGTYTTTVTDLSLSGYTYDSASNIETSESLTI